MKFKLLLVLIVIISMSCTSMTEEAKRLKVTDRLSDVQGCRQVGTVQASSGFSNDGGMLLVGNHNSSVKLRNLAARYGDTLLLVKDESGLTGSDREGIVYRCAQ